jgi:aryl-alcohol dehydrogenase-like predicted oxidoreductase
MSPAEIQADVTESLRCLQTDRIDLYWLHRDDVAVPVSEIIDTMNDLAQSGQIRYFGCSNWSVDRIEAANHYARSQGLEGFVANQPLWSLGVRNPESITDKTLVTLDPECLEHHRQTGLAAIPYSSQANGYFTKRAEGRMKEADHKRFDNPTNDARFERAQALAAQYGVSITAIVLSYLTSQPFPVVAVIGPRTLDQLEDSLRDCDLTLSLDEIAALESV